MKPGLKSGDSRPRKNSVLVSAAEDYATGAGSNQNSDREEDLKRNQGQQQHRTDKYIFKTKGVL